MDQSTKDLVVYFKERQREVDPGPAPLNVVRAAEQLDFIIMDIGLEETRELIDFYFTRNRRVHDFKSFAYNYDDLRVKRERIQRDREHRQRLHERTEQLLNKENNEE